MVRPLNENTNYLKETDIKRSFFITKHGNVLIKSHKQVKITLYEIML